MKKRVHRIRMLFERIKNTSNNETKKHSIRKFSSRRSECRRKATNSAFLFLEEKNQNARTSSTLSAILILQYHHSPSLRTYFGIFIRDAAA